MHLDEFATIKCIQYNQAITFCWNQKCRQKNAFICSYIRCQCNIAHTKCQRGSIEMAYEFITEKLQNTRIIKKQINDLIRKAIQRLNKLKQNIWGLIQEQFINLSKVEIAFYKLFKNQQTQQNYQVFTGKNLSHLGAHINDQMKSKTNPFDQIKEKLKKFQKQQKKNRHMLLQQILKCISNKNIKQQMIVVQSIKNIKDSTIINSKNSINKLIQFFPKKIKDFKLLFKASEYNFRIQEYYKICGHQTNTIIACLNENNKILGGFTPLYFDPGMAQYSYDVADHSMSSFVFSLTTNEKFSLKIKQEAIYRRRDRDYISFGTYFFIGGNARTQNQSGLYLDDGNYDSLKHKSDLRSNLQIIGSQNGHFKLKQWEVIKVFFSE